MHIILHPFNDPWSDESRRQFFWEYLYRSALFGEFSFTSSLLLLLARTIIILSFFCAILGIVGFCNSFFQRMRAHLPLLLTTIILLVGHLLFRIRYPYSSSQDFRYSLLLIVPMTFFTVIGMGMLPRMRRVTVSLVTLFIGSCAIFIGMLSFL